MGFFSRLLGTKKEETPKELAAEEALEGGSELAPELAPEKFAFEETPTNNGQPRPGHQLFRRMT